MTKLALFVPDEFRALVDAYCEGADLPIRLGGRIVAAGPQVGKVYIGCDLFNSCIEWQELIKGFLSGGTAFSLDGPVIQPGRTAEFTDPQGIVWGPYTIEMVETDDLWPPGEEE